MVTFALPGDDVAEPNHGTPRSRPPLPFAKRAFANSPYSSKQRLSTPQGGSKQLLRPRDELPSASFNKGSFSGARNLFRASAISDSPPSATSFSPNLPQSTMKRVFAPGATPEPTRTFRDSVAQATPRGVATKATDKELFSMRIDEPAAHLTGDILAKQIPKEWNSKTSIYADQYLAHLCPAGFDDEQRRQFFCVLDLRRLKYAADEIFSKKSWRLNMMNFAKEFEKSRSIILLRYGLYEFQNVKPSKEVLKRWRREHGLPDPDEDEEPSSLTPSKPTSSKKRRATDDDVIPQGKRRAAEKDDLPTAAPLALPAPSSVFTPVGNKRKASVGDDTESQPSKLQKTPSASKSMFERAVNKASTTPADSPAKPSMFSTSKPVNGSSLARSVFENIKSKTTETPSASASSNIFGHLSDTGSGRQSEAEADDESDSQSDEAENPKAPSPEKSPGAEEDTASATKQTSRNGTDTGLSSSAAGTRESTPGRSLFDRVSKASDGQPVRAEAPTETPAKTGFDKTWNPDTTPIKFGPAGTASQPTGLFGASTSAPTSSGFTPKPAGATNIFGAPKQDKTADVVPKPVEDVRRDAGESDKENDSERPSKKAAIETKATEAPTFGASLFAPQSAPVETAKDTAPVKSSTSMFGTAPTPFPTSNLFGSVSKTTDDTTPPPPVMQSSTLFGAKPAEPEKGAPTTEVSKPSNLFGTANNTTSTNNIFGAKPASAASNHFGSSSSTPASKPLFGNASEPTKSDPPKFSFGAAGSTQANGTAPSATPLFGAPKSPPASGAGNMFDGSPMKQDEASPAKKSTADQMPRFGFGGSTSTPLFGGAPTNTSTAAPVANLFGGASTPSATNPGSTSNIFGQTSSDASTAAPSNMFGGLSNSSNSAPAFGNAAPASSFNFSFGGAPTNNAGPAPGSGINNPFSSGTSDAKVGGTSSPFTFGGAPAAPTAPSGGSAFQFGGGAPATSSGGFGTNGQASTSNAAVSFGGFGASSQPVQNNGTMAFGNNTSPNVFNLPPTAGASTGTNTPFTLGGSSLATTPARGTPEPSAPKAEDAKGGEDEDGEKHEQISLTEGVEDGEEQLHEVRAKALKFTPVPKEDGEEKPKSKSPWSTQGVGSLRLLKNKESGVVRLLLRAEPRGNVAMNRAVLPDISYKADEKYVKMTTSNEKGDGLETWMIQVKTKDLAKGLAEALEQHKDSKKK